MIFLYHRVVADDAPDKRCWSNQTLRLRVFRQHLTWLSRRFRIVPLSEYVQTPRPWLYRLAALTFDDGLARTVQLLLPELDARRLSATMFIPTAHFDDDQVYWFAYLDALCFESQTSQIQLGGESYPLGTDDERRRARRVLGTLAHDRGRPVELADELRRLYPLSATLTEEYRSMSSDEIRAVLRNGRIEFGSHSVTHPYLDRLVPAAQFDEIASSRHALEQVTGRPVAHFAYPAGAYDRASLDGVRAAGFQAAFACVPHRASVDRRFELGRIGVYSPSLPKLVAKTFGLAHVLRAFRIAAG